MVKMIGATALALAVGLLATQACAGKVPRDSAKTVQHGHWLVNVGGCNDCHTPGWAANGGTAPKDKLLIGSAYAFQGPWGTTYPINLRLFVRSIDVQQWIRTVRTTKARPLMPWWEFKSMSDYDLASIYYYIHSLGPAGKPAHAWIPPGEPAQPPYLKLVLPAPPARGKH